MEQEKKIKPGNWKKPHNHSYNYKFDIPVDSLKFDIEIIKNQALYLIRGIMIQDLRDMYGSHYYRSIKFFGNDDSDTCKANTYVLL